jgi:DNA polymerase
MGEAQESKEIKGRRLDSIRQNCIDTVANGYPGEGKVVVFGEGNPDAEIVLVGEAPGEKETKLVKPFVGQAGKNLDEFMKILGPPRLF